ncbi:MAG: hypothetical protein HYU66_16755, partial [Armatimonadetes bacterium]|nr:hypothetical protein [Armatimonadota bacterium]
AALEARLAARLDGIEAEPAEPAASVRPQRAAAPRRAPRRAWITPARVAALAALFVLGALPFSLHRRPQWDFHPDALARNHTYWQDQFRAQPASQVITPAEEASRLARVVNYAVTPPNTEALGARLVGCTACKGSFPTHKPVAVFVMRRGTDNDMTLFELKAPHDTVTQHGFQPLDGRDVQVASSQGVNLALWSAENLHLCLASNRSAVRELADLVPRAVGGCPTAAERPRGDYGLQLVSDGR